MKIEDIQNIEDITFFEIKDDKSDDKKCWVRIYFGNKFNDIIIDKIQLETLANIVKEPK